RERSGEYSGGSSYHDAARSSLPGIRIWPRAALASPGVGNLRLERGGGGRVGFASARHECAGDLLERRALERDFLRHLRLPRQRRVLPQPGVATGGGMGGSRFLQTGTARLPRWMARRRYALSGGAGGEHVASRKFSRGGAVPGFPGLVRIRTPSPARFGH